MKTSKMKNENTMIASMILSWLSLLMLSITCVGGPTICII